MPRKPRIIYPNAYYHVMNRGAARRHIFFSAGLKNTFVALLKVTVEQYRLNLISFCIMGNHYHLLIHDPESNLSDAMRFLNGSYARIYNQIRGKDGPIFRDRFKSVVVENNSYLMAVTRYIHRNPLEAGIVHDLSMYTWSSYVDYTQKIVTHPWIAKLDFGQTQEEYRRFVSKRNSQKLINFYNKEKIGKILR